MFTQKQSKGSLWMGLAAVLTMTSAVAAQGHGSSAQTGALSELSKGTHAIAPAIQVIGVLTELEWTDLGFSLAGVSGAPHFVGSGQIAPGERAKLSLTGAAPNAMAMIFVSLGSAPMPFKGGMLVPAAPAFTLLLATDGLGDITLGISASDYVPGGFNLVMQYAIVDEAAPQGVALSNALQTSTH